MDYCVLGSSTFTAVHFIKDKLSEGKKVLAISRSENKQLYKNLIGKDYDKLNFIFLKLHLINDNVKIINSINKYQPKYIVDFSGQGMVAESWEKPSLWFETNVVAKVKLYDSLLNKKWLSRIIKISTPEVYGSNKSKIKEGSNFNTSTPYAVSQSSIDLYLGINQKFKKLPVIFARFANFYGEGQQPYRIIPKAILSTLYNKKFFLHGKGKSLRSFIHVADVSRAISKCIIKGKIGSTYHFSTDEQVSIHNLCKKIINMQNKKFENICLIKKSDRLGKDYKYDMDIRQTQKELKWKPNIKLDQGLIRTFNWFKENKILFKNTRWDFQLRK